jgi:hypothetical protein
MSRVLFVTWDGGGNAPPRSGSPGSWHAGGTPSGFSGIRDSGN